MSPMQELKSTERDDTLNPRQLRAAGYVPATLYGKNVEPRSLQVRAHEFQQLFTQGVRQFQLTGYLSCAVKAQAVQLDPVSQKPLSIQFMPLEPLSAAPAAAQPASKSGKAASRQEESAAALEAAEQPAEQAEALSSEPAETVLSGA